MVTVHESRLVPVVLSITDASTDALLPRFALVVALRSVIVSSPAGAGPAKSSLPEPSAPCHLERWAAVQE